MYKIEIPPLDYDVYPKVLKVGEKTKVTVRPLGDHVNFSKSDKITGIIMGMSNQDSYDIDFHTEDDGSGWFEMIYPSEQMYEVRLKKGDNWLPRSTIYAVEADLYGKYAYIGDLHIHSTRSDGHQAPAVVAANYRKFGYDFMAVTDHGVFYGSLEAINAYKDVPLDLALFTGEEVHLDGNGVHIINFGGNYSINGLITESHQCNMRGTGPEWRSVDGKTAPETIGVEEYRRQVNEILKELNPPDTLSEAEKFEYASSVWAYRNIRKANGVSLFCHPYWKANAFQISENLTRHMLKEHKFDAFEVLGGECYYEQNGFQTARYYDDLKNGIEYAVVGTTDSHDSTASNPGAYVARTMVFAPSKEHDDIVNAIRGKNCVAFDGMANIFVGDNRLVRYAWFLMQNYFPLHDELCFEEGRQMKIYVTGSAEERLEAKVALEFLYGNMDKLRKKYFGF